MDYFVADQIKSDYIDEIAKEECFHSLHFLGHTKEAVITAYKVSSIHMVKYQTHEQEFFDQEMFLLMNLNSFMGHEDYIKWNTIEQKEPIEPEELRELLRKQSETLFASDAYYQVNQFVETIQKLDRNDPLFFQKAYTIAGIEYKPEYRMSMERADRFNHSMEALNQARKLINQGAIASEDKSIDSYSHSHIRKNTSQTTNNSGLKMALIFTVITIGIIFYLVNI